MAQTRDQGNNNHVTVLEARDVGFAYPSTDDFALEAVDLEVKAGRCVALMGFNAQGKSTLCKILGKVVDPVGSTREPPLRPTRGRVVYTPRRTKANGLFFTSNIPIDPNASTSTTSFACVGATSAACAALLTNVLATTLFSQRLWWWALVIAILCAAAMTSVVERARRRFRDARYRSRVAYVTTENDAARHVLDDSWTVADGVTNHLRWALSRDDRLALAERLLSWAGFRHHVQKVEPNSTPNRPGDDDIRAAMSSSSDQEEPEMKDAAEVVAEGSLTCGELSGGQRHLVYFLRALAPIFAASHSNGKNNVPWLRRLFPRVFGLPEVDALLLDEALNCFDADVRPRAMRLARWCVDEANVACVVVTQVMHEIAALCDEAVFLDAGRVVHRATDAKHLVAVPSTFNNTASSASSSSSRRIQKLTQHPRCRAYLDAFWSLERDMRLAAGRSADLAPCGAHLAAQIAALPPILRLGPPWERAALVRGDRVRILGLAAQQRFNSKDAVVLKRIDVVSAHPSDKQHGGTTTTATLMKTTARLFPRFKVRLRDGQILAVRRANLELLAPHDTKDVDTVSKGR